jgi:hypothetical protein
MFLVFSVFDAIKDLKLYKGGIPLILEVAFLLFWTFTKRREQQRIPHEWRDRVNFQQTITGRSTSKDKGSFLIGSSYGHLFLKLSEEQKNNSVYFMI